MQCDHACAHCGSRAGRARARELTTSELLSVADALVGLGTREVTLIGGEAYLRDDVGTLIHHLTAAGVRVTMQSGGRGLTRERCHQLREAGLVAVGISIDGPAREHDRLRASLGSHAAAVAALDHARAAGLLTTANSQINRLNRHTLRELAAKVRDHGARVWRPQLTVPMGRAADHPEWILEPYMVLDVIDTLAAIQIEAMQAAREHDVALDRAFHIQLGNNVGYYGPHEELLRSRPGQTATYWQGCQAGRYTLGIESDGNVKACPSLPSAPYVGGNVLELSLEHIWSHTEEIAFARTRTSDELWGRCRDCYYADTCRAGCSFTAHCTLGRRGNNPFCYYRADQLRRGGRRERLVHKQIAPGQPYDFGQFVLVEEPWVAGLETDASS